MSVADVSRQFRQMGFDVLVGSVPVAQRPNDKAMAQVVNARALVIGGPTQADLMGQADEPAACNPIGQAGALLR